MSRYRSTYYRDTLPNPPRLIRDTQAVLAQCLPFAIPTIEREDLFEYLRHSNLSTAYRAYLQAEREKAQAS